jgi:hypothetical protein
LGLELLYASLNNLGSTNVLSLGQGLYITLNIVFIVMLALHDCCLAGLTEQAAKREQKNYQSVKKL